MTDTQPDRLPAAKLPLRHGAYAWQTRWRPGELATARFMPMGLHLELVTNSPPLLAAARQCFGGYGEPAPDRPVDLTLRLYQHSVDAPAPGAGVATTAATSGHLATATAAAANPAGTAGLPDLANTANPADQGFNGGSVAAIHPVRAAALPEAGPPGAATSGSCVAATAAGATPGSVAATAIHASTTGNAAAATAIGAAMSGSSSAATAADATTGNSAAAAAIGAAMSGSSSAATAADATTGNSAAAAAIGAAMSGSSVAATAADATTGSSSAATAADATTGSSSAATAGDATTGSSVAATSPVAAMAGAAAGGRDVHFFDGGAAGAPLSAPILRCEGPYLYQASGSDTVMVADRGAGVTFGYLAAATVADAAHLTWHYLWPAVSYHLECRGFAGVHAAAIARRGRGLLLRGRSGQGKTTLTYAATRRGWQAVSEDIVWVDARGATWWGSPWTFHLLPDARQLFSELSGRGVALQPNGEVKVVVDMESLWPGSTLPKAAAGPVVILERRHGGTSSLVTLDPATAHHEWLDGCARHERQAPGYDQTVADLLSRGCHRLHLGDDLDGALDLLEPLLP